MQRRPSQDITSTGATSTGAERAWTARMAALAASYHRLMAQDPSRRSARLEELLQSSAKPLGAPNWSVPNEIEYLLLPMLVGPDLDLALDGAILSAEQLAVPSLAGLTKRREVLVRDDEKQALLARLLRDIHLRRAARQSERIERRKAAGRLARLGFVLTGGLVAVLVGLGLQADHPGGHQLLAQYNLALTTGFGILGAYVSRLVAFQTGAAQLSVDDLENGYAWQMLLLRLLVGGVSALVVYFVIAGRLIGGELLPQALGVAGGFGRLWQDHGADGYSGPTPAFAKLIVWCFLAGFSERFLPDSLSALEAKGRV